MFLFQMLSHLIPNHNCHFSEELILYSFDITEGIVLNGMVGEGLFAKVAFKQAKKISVENVFQAGKEERMPQSCCGVFLLSETAWYAE